MADFLHDNDDTLMKYLDGEMDQTEKEKFESQLQHDDLLQQKLERLQVAIASVQQYGTTEKVKAIHSEMMQELSPVHKEGKLIPMKVIRYSLAIAASIIVILVGVNIFTASQPSPAKLYNEAFVDYVASTVRGSENETGVTKLYQQHNYDAVIGNASAQNLSSKDSLLVGLSYLKTSKLNEAINWFKAISAENPTKQDAEFYLAMTYLKNENYGEALNMMEEIRSNSNHVYRNQFSEDYVNKVKKLNSK